MKRTATLVLLLLLALVSSLPCLAQAPSPTPVTGAVSAPVADFLATLPGVPATGTPSPTFLSTLCNTSADCPAGQLCCYPCGIDGCHNVCMNPVKGRCPLFP